MSLLHLSYRLKTVTQLSAELLVWVERHLGSGLEKSGGLDGGGGGGALLSQQIENNTPI